MAWLLNPRTSHPITIPGAKLDTKQCAFSVGRLGEYAALTKAYTPEI
jgi:hypothetical protein